MMSTNQNAPRKLLFGTFQIHVDQKTLFNAFLVVMRSYMGSYNMGSYKILFKHWRSTTSDKTC